MARLLNVVLSEDQVGARGHRLGVAREAHLGAVLGGQRVAVVLQLLVGAALALALARAGHAVLRHQRLQTKLDRDRHQLGALCYLRVSLHLSEQLQLLIDVELGAAGLFEPSDLPLGLLVDFDQVPADREKLILKGVSQVCRPRDLTVHHKCRIKHTRVVTHECQY